MLLLVVIGVSKNGSWHWADSREPLANKRLKLTSAAK